MASLRWSNLPPEILSIIAKILNADVEILRLRAVCSSWRSSIRARRRPSPFPLRVPPLFAHYPDEILPSGGLYSLNYTTLYRLSPPENAPHAGDPSDDWLFRVSEVNPNRFLILAPLLPKKAQLAPGTVPKHLNLLDHRISEVCKCYSLNFVDDMGAGNYLNYIVRKVVVLWNYTVDCEFAVIALYSDMLICYWKFGDKAWTPVDAEGYDITDVVVCDGICYAIGRQGLLVSFDSKFKLKAVPIRRLPVDCTKSENYLVEYKSDLYVVSKICDNTCIIGDNGEVFDHTSLHLKIFKKCDNDWKRVRDLGNEMLISSDDVSVGLSAEYFKGRGSNCVYVAQTDYFAFSFCYGQGKGLHHGVFHLDGDRTSAFKSVRGDTLHWPPPGWLKKIARDDSSSSLS